MKESPKENQLGTASRMLLLVVLLLCALTFVGSFDIGGFTTRRVDLFSDLTRGIVEKEDELPDDELFFAQLPVIPSVDSVAVVAPPVEPPPPAPFPGPADTAAPAPASRSVADSMAYDRAADSVLPPRDIPDSLFRPGAVIPIEDFSPGGVCLGKFYRKLQHIDGLGRPLRIAFLGDSFIEGDILTSDLREFLQSIYGGRGVGFVPLAPIDKYRNTVNIDHDGWKIRSSLYGSHEGRYLINGQCFVPEGTASVSVRTTGQREHATQFDRVSLLYINGGPTVMKYSLRGSDYQEKVLPAKGGLQLTDLRRENMRSAEVRIEQAEEFTGYGLYLHDDTGIYVDNFSLRSSTGMQLLRVSASMLRQLNELVPYDLIVLQYGLNLVEPDRKDYQSYKEAMIRVIERIKEAMPEAGIIVLGIADRNYKSDEGDMVTKIGVLNLIETQRNIAAEAQTAFWNTYLAMGGRNSMRNFVSGNLANKDYTHINYRGGKKIAEAFGKSLLQPLYGTGGE